MSNFHYTAEIPSIRIENGNVLHARIFKADGEHVESQINLNDFIGNQDGHFAWGGQSTIEPYISWSQ